MIKSEYGIIIDKIDNITKNIMQEYQGKIKYEVKFQK